MPFLLLGVVPIALFVLHARKTNIHWCCVPTVHPEGAVSQRPWVLSPNRLVTNSQWPTHADSVQSRPCAVQPGMAARVLNKLVCWPEPTCTHNYCSLLANHCCFLHISTPHSCAGLRPPLRSQAFTLVILEHGSLPNTFGSYTIKGISCLPNDCGQMQAWATQQVLHQPLCCSHPPSPVRSELLLWDEAFFQICSFLGCVTLALGIFHNSHYLLCMFLSHS